MSAITPTSPRLPSPPPAAEIPAGLQSISAFGLRPAEEAQAEANSTRRIHRGSKATDMPSGPPLVNLSELDSPFQLQEHLAALHYHYTDKRTKPINRTTASVLANPPNGVDRTLWLYELCRFLINNCNLVITGLLFDNPPCSPDTCPEMRASEWQYLCSVHEAPKNCCAIDYCCHTLDSAANVLTDTKVFPSRLSIISEPHTRSVATKNMLNIFRRAYRIFAHAWFLHRDVFWNVENAHGVYLLFISVCDVFDILPADSYRLPPEAQGLPPVAAPLAPEPVNDRKVSGPITVIKQFSKPIVQSNGPSRTAEGERSSSRGSSRNERGRPSAGSQVSTVPEDIEDEEPTSHWAAEDEDAELDIEDDTADAPKQSHNGEPTQQPESRIPKLNNNASPEPEVPIIVESTMEYKRESGVLADVPSRPKTASPKPGASGMKVPASKLPKASPRPASAKLRTMSPAPGDSGSVIGIPTGSQVPPAMNMASGGTVVATPAPATERSPMRLRPRQMPEARVVPEGRRRSIAPTGSRRRLNLAPRVSNPELNNRRWTLDNPTEFTQNLEQSGEEQPESGTESEAETVIAISQEEEEEDEEDEHEQTTMPTQHDDVEEQDAGETAEDPEQPNDDEEEVDVMIEGEEEEHEEPLVELADLEIGEASNEPVAVQQNEDKEESAESPVDAGEGESEAKVEDDTAKVDDETANVNDEDEEMTEDKKKGDDETETAKATQGHR